MKETELISFLRSYAIDKKFMDAQKICNGVFKQRWYNDTLGK